MSKAKFILVLVVFVSVPVPVKLVPVLKTVVASVPDNDKVVLEKLIAPELVKDPFEVALEIVPVFIVSEPAFTSCILNVVVPIPVLLVNVPPELLLKKLVPPE